jgi:hypothetical protein
MSLALPLLAGLASLMATIIQMCMPYVIGLCVSLLLILYPAFVVYSIVNPRSWWVPLADWARAGIWFYSWMIFIVIGRGMLDGAAMADLTQNGASFDNGADIGWSVRQFIGVGLITMAPMLASAILAPSFQALASGIQGVNGQVSRVGGALVTLAVAAVTAGAGAVAGAGAAKAGAKAAASTTGSDEAKAAAYDRAERRSMQSSQGVLGSIRGAGDLGGAFGSEQGSMGQGSAAAGNLSRGMEQVGTTTGGRVGEARQAASARSAIDRFNADPNPSADTQEAARQGANILAGNPMAGLDSGGGSMTANQASRGSFHQRAGQRNSMSATQMDSKAADLEVAAESAPPADAAAMRAQAQSLRSGAAEQWSAASKNYESAGGALMKAGNARDAASSYTHAAESAAHANQPERAREMLAHAGGARSLADSMAPRPDEDGGKAAALSQQQAIGGQMAAVEAGGRGMRLAGLTPTDSKAALGAYLTRGESAVMGMPPAQAEAVRQMGASVTKAQSMLNQEAGAASVALDQAQSEFKANPSAATAQRVAAASHRLASASSESQYLSDRYGAPGAVGNPSSRLDAAAQDVEGSGVAGSGFYGNSIKAASQVLQGDRSGAADSLRLAAGDTSMSPQMQTNARHAAEMIGTTGASGMPPAHAMEILTNGVGGNSHGGVVGQGMQVFAGLHRENPVMERQPAPTSGVDLPSIAWSASTGALGGEGVPATGGAVNGDVGRMVEIVGGAGAPANQPVPMPGDPGTAPAPSVVPVVGGAPITGAPVAGPSVPVAGGATGSPTPDVSAISGGGPTTSMTGGIPGSPHGTSEAANATGGRPRNEQTGG